MKQPLLFIILSLASCYSTSAQTSFATADTMSAGIVNTGSLSASSTVHYYKTVLSGNGIIRLVSTTTNNGTANGVLRYQAFYKNQSSIAYTDISRAPSATGSDTLMIGSVAADTIYFLVQNTFGGQPFNYTLKYDLLGASPNNETAANETVATAELLPMNTARDGHISFNSVAGTDVDDYYKIVFNTRGTVRIFAKAMVLYTGGSAPSPQVYILNKAGNALSYYRATGYAAGYQAIGAYNGGPLVTVYDTFSVFGRAEDTMYIRVNNYHYGLSVGWPASYSLRWTAVDTAASNEQEPNNTLAQAQPINEGDTVKGSISLTNTAGTDVEDYYRIVMAKDATLTLYVSSTNIQAREPNPSVGVYALMKGGGGLTVANNAGAQGYPLRVRNEGQQAFLSTINDTMHVYARAKDTFYIQVENYHFGLSYPWAAHYTLRYRLTDTVASNEAEPNNSIATAHPITQADTVRGTVSYINSSNVSDNDDYFRIVKPAGGTIRLFISARNNWGYTTTAWALVVQAFTPTGAALLVKSAIGAFAYTGMLLRGQAYQPYGTTLTDTMRIECVAADTMYLKLWNPTGANSYEFRYEYLPSAKSGIAYARTGNEFGFINQAINADSYLWLMGNSAQYTSFNAPVTSYGPGNYDVKLIAVDNVCNYRDTAKVNITVAGVEYYTPMKAGRGGDASIQIYGGALDTGTTLTLIKGTSTLTPIAKYTNGRLNHLTAEFDLHNADTGLYDVIIQVPGQAPITYTKGFLIENFEYPYAWSQVVGPARMRTNTDNRYTLLVGNRGNVTANGVVVAMIWPKNVQVSWTGTFSKPNYSKNDTLVTDTDTYIFPNTIYDYIYDSTNTTTAIDTFEGKPYDGYMRFLQVPHVPANGSVEFPFIARAASPASVRFITYTHHPNIFGSCPSGNYEDYGNDMSAELVDAADMMADKTKVPLFQAFTKTAKIGQKHMQSLASYAGKEFWAWYDGYETDHDANMNDWLRETDANNEYALQTFALEAGGGILNASVAKAGVLQNRVNAVNQFLAKNPNMSARNFDKAIDFLNKNGKAISGINYDRLKVLKGLFDNVKNAGDLSEKLLKLQELANDCPELKDQIKDLQDLLGQELDHQDLQPTIVDTRNSFDPNGIYGPSGIDTLRYINNVKRQPFIIHFENVDTAGADAQDVTIRDTIDKSHFDIATVEFSDVIVANQLIRVPKGRQQFVVQHRMANMAGMQLRVIANTDTAAGVITWRFTSIDSATLARPLLNGFLRPNVNKPEGEASVGYMISPRTNLADGTVLNSKASIVFDANAAISTDVWSNKLDIGNPTSSITSGMLRDDTLVRLNLAGSDTSSGVRSYTVYYSTNSGPWYTLGRTATDSMIFIGQYDSSYRFYATAVDNVGNMETKAAIAEYTVTIPTAVDNASLASRGTAFTIYPNPASGKLFLRVITSGDDDISINLRNLTGQHVAQLYSGKASGTFTIGVDISHLPAGVYMVQLETGHGITNTAKLVIVH